MVLCGLCTLVPMMALGGAGVSLAGLCLDHRHRRVLVGAGLATLLAALIIAASINSGRKR